VEGEKPKMHVGGHRGNTSRKIRRKESRRKGKAGNGDEGRFLCREAGNRDKGMKVHSKRGEIKPSVIGLWRVKRGAKQGGKTENIGGG